MFNEVFGVKPKICDEKADLEVHIKTTQRMKPKMLDSIEFIFSNEILTVYI